LYSIHLAIIHLAIIYLAITALAITALAITALAIILAATNKVKKPHCWFDFRGAVHFPKATFLGSTPPAPHLVSGRCH
jgi:hypothetical protein